MAGALGVQDGVDGGRGPVHLAGLVDDHVVVVLRSSQLDGRVALADLELIGGLGRPRTEAPEERLERRRDQEDEQGVRGSGLDRGSTLDIDLEDHVAAGLECVEHLATRRAVPVAMDLGGLEQLAGVAQLA